MIDRNKESWANYAIIIVIVGSLVITAAVWYYSFVIPSEVTFVGSCISQLSKCSAIVYNDTLYVEFFNFNSDIKNATFYFSPNNNLYVVIHASNAPIGKPLNFSNAKTFVLEFNLSGTLDLGYVYAVGYYRNGTAFNMTVATVLKPNVTTERPNVSNKINGGYSGMYPRIPYAPKNGLILSLINEAQPLTVKVF